MLKNKTPIHRKNTIRDIITHYATTSQDRDPGEYPYGVIELLEVVEQQQFIIGNLGNKLHNLRKQYRSLQRSHKLTLKILENSRIKFKNVRVALINFLRL